MGSEQASRRIQVGWALWPLFVAGFLFTRYVVPASWGIGVAQLFYLAPLLGAVLALATTARRSIPGSRARLVWSSFSVASAGILIGEIVTSLRLLGVMPRGAADLVFDTANAAAMVCAGIGLALGAAVDRVEMMRAVRFTLDVLAVAAAAFAFLYRVWIVGGAAGEGSVAVAWRMSAYGIAGLALIVGASVAVATRPAFRTPWHVLIVSATGLLIAGLWIWTASEYAGWEHEQGAVLGAISSVVYMSGYHLAFMAGLYRTRRNEGHALVPGKLTPPSAALGIAFSSLGLISVVALSWMVVDADAHNLSTLVYVVALTIATVCMVVRTTLASAETQSLTARSVIDPVTGGLSVAALPRCFSEAQTRLQRTGEPFAVLSVGLDDFSRMNAALGYRGGDHLLAAIDRALRDCVGRGAQALRLQGDEFVVLAPIADRRGALALSRRVLGAVRSADAEHPVTASVGFTLVTDAGIVQTDVLSDAETAQAWAKRHGKNRVVGFDERIQRALMTDERLKTVGEGASIDMARALVAAMDARDPANRYHARNVAAIVRLIAEGEGLSPEHVNHLEVAAVLHDVGKITLPSVPRGGRMQSARARSAEREHSALGGQLLESLGVEGVAAWVRAHHERWDGNGYPDGLAGEEIPFEARLIALADAYDGMTTGTRYGAPMSKAAALQEIDFGMGVRYDPVLAERFILAIATADLLGWSDEWPES